MSPGAAPPASSTFRLNATSLAGFRQQRQLITKSLSTSSTWGCLLGVRLIF
ncbi:MAG: hypothetical protein MZV63_50555 [Marinilabiliales bacterium]|nr:hypothetical protein [Marinilabiliales bacterium]